MDVAILDYVNLQHRAVEVDLYKKVDEIPFDFNRRRMSVVVEDDEGKRLLITKGAVEEIFNLSTQIEINGEVLPRLPEHDAKRKALVEDLNKQGFRVIGLAYKWLPKDASGTVTADTYTVADEKDLVLKGFLAFLDPPKDTAQEALTHLDQHKVAVKILTGDNDLVTATIVNRSGYLTIKSFSALPLMD